MIKYFNASTIARTRALLTHVRQLALDIVHIRIQNRIAVIALSTFFTIVAAGVIYATALACFWIT